MSEVVRNGGEMDDVVEVDLATLGLGDWIVVTTANSVYQFEKVAHSFTPFKPDQCDHLKILSRWHKRTGEEIGLTMGFHYRDPNVVIEGSYPVDGRIVTTTDDLDHHVIRIGCPIAVLMDEEERNGNISRFVFSAPEEIKVIRR